MARRYFSSTAVGTTLTAGIDDDDTSITVAAATGFPTSFPWVAVIDYDTTDEEIVEVNAASGTTLTITRGVDGTSGKAHGSGAKFRHAASGRDFDEANAHVNDSSTDVHGQYVLKSLLGAINGVATLDSGGQIPASQLGNASGAKASGAIYENAQTISSNYTMTSSYNGLSAGPITIGTGISVTVPSGSVWAIV